MKMKYFAIPLGIMWALLMILTMLGFDESSYAEDDRIIMPIFGIMTLLIILLIIAFFKENKDIKKRQKLTQEKKNYTEKETGSNTDKDFLCLEKKVQNPEKIFVAGLIFIVISPFF